MAADLHARAHRAVGLNGNTRHELTAEKCVRETLDGVRKQCGGSVELKKTLFHGVVLNLRRRTSEQTKDDGFYCVSLAAWGNKKNKPKYLLHTQKHIFMDSSAGFRLRPFAEGKKWGLIKTRNILLTTIRLHNAQIANRLSRNLSPRCESC